MRRRRRKKAKRTGLWCVFEDPDADARIADVFWRPDACREVLPVIASNTFGAGSARRLSLHNLRCRVTALPDHTGDHSHILFAEHGRFFQ